MSSSVAARLRISCHLRKAIPCQFRISVSVLALILQSSKSYIKSQGMSSKKTASFLENLSTKLTIRECRWRLWQRNCEAMPTEDIIPQLSSLEPIKHSLASVLYADPTVLTLRQPQVSRTAPGVSYALVHNVICRSHHGKNQQASS